MKIKLTNGKYIMIDKEDYKYFKDKNLMDRGGYAAYLVYNKRKATAVFVHQVVMNAKKGQVIDHINRDPYDNRKKNLRYSSKSQNAANCKIHKHNTSGYKGVSKYKDKWRAYIVFMDKQKHIGIFETKELAAEAYNKSALEIFGEHANINEVKKK